eukprot:s3654_g3.t1
MSSISGLSLEDISGFLASLQQPRKKAGRKAIQNPRDEETEGALELPERSQEELREYLAAQQEPSEPLLGRPDIKALPPIMSKIPGQDQDRSVAKLLAWVSMPAKNADSHLALRPTAAEIDVMVQRQAMGRSTSSSPSYTYEYYSDSDWEDPRKEAAEATKRKSGGQMRSSSSERDDRKPPAMREDKTKEEAEEVRRREEKKREQRAAAAAAAVAGVLGGKDYRSWSPVTAPPADRWSGWSRGGGWQQKEWWREQPQREERQPWEVRLQCRDEGNRAELAAVFGVQQKVQVPVQLRPALERQAPKPGTTTTGSRAGRSLGLLCCRPGGKHLPGHDSLACTAALEKHRGKVNDTTDSMTAKQAANLRLYIQAIAAERRNHEFDLAVVELDRCPLRAIGGRIYKDRVPSLRTRGPLLFVLSTADIHLPSSQMEFHRYVLPDERLIFQGRKAKMSEDDRVEWYKKQKAKREAEGFSNKKRTFESGVGIVEENLTRHSGSDDVARWIRFRDWGATERMTKTINGEVLLRVWSGVEDRDGSRHSITAGLKQRCDLHNSEDLEAFGAQAEMRLARGEALLRADRMSSDASGVNRESTLLQIQADMEATSRQRMQAEQLLYEEAEKIEERKKQLASAKPKISSAALEKLQFENSIGRAKSSCDTALIRFKTASKTLKLEIEQMSEQDSTTMSEMKTRADQFQDIYNGAEKYLEEKIEHLGCAF